MDDVIKEPVDCKHVMGLQLNITTANYTRHLQDNCRQCHHHQQQQQQQPVSGRRVGKYFAGKVTQTPNSEAEKWASLQLEEELIEQRKT